MEYNIISYSRAGSRRTLTDNLYVKTPRFKGVYLHVGSLVIEDDTIMAIIGFEWNGCTGVRDSHRSDVGCCVHDLLNKYKPYLPFGNDVIDLILLDCLEEQKFRLSKIFYYMVRWFGNFFKE